MNKSLQQIKQDYSNNAAKARQQKEYNLLLNSCTPADRKAIALLE